MLGGDVADVVIPSNAHFLCHAIIPPLSPYSDVGDVVSQALLLACPEYLGDYIRCVKIT